MENNTTSPIPPLCSNSVFYILSLIVSSFTMVMIVVTNVLIVIVTWRTKRKIMNPGLFLSLAMSDLLLGVLVLPIDIYYAAWSAEARPSFGLCTFSGVAFDILKTVSLFSFFGISLERCVAIVFPYNYKSLYRKRNNILNVAIIWLIPTLLYGALPVCNLGMYVHKCWQSMCNLGMVNMKYLTFLMLLSILVFVATYITNGIVYYSARKHQKKMEKTLRYSIRSGTTRSNLPSSAQTDATSNKAQFVFSQSSMNSEKSNHSKSVSIRESDKVDDLQPGISQTSVQPLEEGGQPQNTNSPVQPFENTNPSPSALPQTQQPFYENKSNGGQNEKKDGSQRRLSKFRAARSIMVALALFTLCWGPYYSCIFLLVLFNIVATPFTEFALLWLAISNSYMNLFVFLLTYKAFRDEFNRIFCKVKSDQSTITATMASST